jgi:methylated-DNA-[protein]-cysteine S-methyltransferase
MTAVRIFETPWGRMAVAATARGLAHVVLPGKKNGTALARLATLEGREAPRTARAHARQAERQISEYLRGRQRAFTIPLDLASLPRFHKRALLAARKIPFGRTVTYGELAARAGRPHAARAVGQAMARNPVPLVVPCHRVVAADGNLGGFGGGAAMKRRLLALENVISTQRPRRAQRKE